MKKSFALLAVAMLSTSAFADDLIADPTAGFQASDQTRSFLNVRGSVVSSTCYIEKKSLQKEVNLPEVESNQLRFANNVAGKTRFDLNVANCPASRLEDGVVKNNVAITFAQSANISASGNLQNTIQGSTLKNVEVQILDKDGNVINLNDRSNAQTATLTANTDKHIFKYSAQYIAVGGSAEAGKFSSNIPFEVIYK